MNKNILFEVKQILQQRRIDSTFAAAQNLKLAQNSFPHFKQLESRRRELGFLIATAKFRGRPYIDLENEQNSIEMKETELLKQIGLTIADFYPKVICKSCSDTGYVDNEAPNALCHCAKKEASKILLSQSGFSKKQLPCFEDSNLDLFKNKAFMTELYIKMQSWCIKSYKNDLNTLVFQGPTGTGKTFLMECMANELIESGEYVYYTTAFDFISEAKEYHYSYSDEKINILKPYLESDALFIDDLGTEPLLKNITLEYLLMVINSRMREGKRTVVTTNLTPPELMDKYDERIISRLFNKKSGALIKIEGSDLRLKKGGAV